MTKFLAWLIANMILALIFGSVVYLFGLLFNFNLSWLVAFKVTFWGATIWDILAFLYNLGAT